MSTNPLKDALEALKAEVTKNLTVGTSAIAFINGVPALIQAAVDKALADGATTAQEVADAMVGLKNDIAAETDNFVAALEPPTV